MTVFRCTSCNFRYEPRGIRKPIICPACGKQTIDQEKSAAELLEAFTEDY